MPVNKLAKIEAERGQLKKLIPDLLRKHDGSQRAVAEELGVTPSTVSVWLKDNGYVQKSVWIKEN